MNRSLRSVISGLAIGIVLASQAGAEGLPDILGIQIGMSAREAYAKLQAQIPDNNVQVISTNLPTIEKPIIATLNSTPKQPMAMGLEGDQIQVDVTLPPNQQAVWRIDRQHSFAGKGIPKATLLASLREKYGKETLTNVQKGRPAADDSQIGDLLWLFDDQGRPASLPFPPEKTGSGMANVLTLSSCITTTSSSGNLSAMEAYVNAPKSARNAQMDWCYSSYTAVHVWVQQSDPPELYGGMRMITVSLPFAVRAIENTMKWKQGIAEDQHKQDIEKAKQQGKPKL